MVAEATTNGSRERSRSPRGGCVAKTGSLGRTSSAFVFLKPHAVTAECQALLCGYFAGANIRIVQEGELTADIIDGKKLIDQHYYAIASKATILKPEALNVPADKFKDKFGLSWEDAKAKKLVFNAADACAELGLDGDGMSKLWSVAQGAKDLVKLGGGFYCAKLSPSGRSDPMYVFNGFFMAMRDTYTAPGKKIHYYVVEWDTERLSWADFRSKVLGPTDPGAAPPSSIRGIVNARWKEFGLAAAPNTGDNAVHASASPFEGMAERCNWLGAKLAEDAFGSWLLAAGIDAAWIEAGCVDPQVRLEAAGDRKGSLFDAVEDTDPEECCQRLVQLSSLGIGK
eukprot:TRINITY_DN68475_c0_g1_i1.p1 TRINITY_DN68475_c0_g1~~TRINITY_DN68475_c0_g1_i1.p1  ORF type:complete len:365 (+),score=78.84 TRINITY_DN68475_c0_g1_i1:74-1096(+)